VCWLIKDLFPVKFVTVGYDILLFHDRQACIQFRYVNLCEIEVFTSVLIMMQVFWEVTLCGSSSSYQDSPACSRLSVTSQRASVFIVIYILYFNSLPHNVK